MSNVIKISHHLFYLFLICNLASANTYTFTSAGATGREGPTQVQVDSNYTDTSLDSAVTVDDNNTQGIQEWTVPANGNYSIEARGARGGASGGLGAKMFGHFYLNSGSNLKILVGQEGSTLNTTGGGGGGTFVVNGTIADGILLVSRWRWI